MEHEHDGRSKRWGTASLADRIREFVHREIKLIVSSPGSVAVIRAGDVHNRMGLTARLPAVCAALVSKIMTLRYGVQVVQRDGPPQGAHAVFHFAQAEPRQLAERQSFAAPRRLPIASSAKTSEPATNQIGGDAVFLVSCVKSKQRKVCAAKDLYDSNWFRSARRFVEGQKAYWLILSAEYGLIHPDQIIAPYEKTLKSMPIADRREWADGVASSWHKLAPSARRVIFLAGASYREFLVPMLAQRGIHTEAPLSNLRQGEQLSWLKINTVPQIV